MKLHRNIAINEGGPFRLILYSGETIYKIIDFENFFDAIEVGCKWKAMSGSHYYKIIQVGYVSYEKNIGNAKLN